MDVAEAMDREVIIERAEAMRFWLLGLPLSHRATSAIQRELGAIIDNDPGGYMNGEHPLAGLTIPAFIAELTRPNGGTVGRVKRVTESMLNELRATIVGETGANRREAISDPAPAASETPQPMAVVTKPLAGGDMPDAPPARRRGRPKGSTKAAKAAKATQGGVVSAHEAPAPTLPQPPAESSAEEAAAEPKRRRGRPRRVAQPPVVGAPASGVTFATMIAPASAELSPVPAEDRAALAERGSDDPMLSQIARLWPSLHPHARRALVMYASSLWAEGGFEG